MDELIDYSGLRDLIDLPMSTYSNGIKARLAFTIATANSPDALVIDEALAVGDASFQAQSSKRINGIRQNAGAVVLVSHNLNEIRNSCDRVYWIEKGRVVAVGDPGDVVDAYEASLAPIDAS